MAKVPSTEVKNFEGSILFPKSVMGAKTSRFARGDAQGDESMPALANQTNSATAKRLKSLLN